MGKKSLFATLSLVLTLCLIILVSLPSNLKIPFSFILSIAAAVLSIIALRENISGIEFVTLTILPTLFTLGMSTVLFYFPNFSLLFKFIFWTTFSFFFYIILLCENIFNVAADKPIPLVRASYTAAFLVTLFTIFPLYTAVFKGDPNLLIAALLIAVLTFALTFQSLWTVFLPKAYDSRTLWGSVVVTLIILEAYAALSFFPLESFFRALGLSTVYYIALGFSHHYFKKSLNSKVYLEYLIVGLIISFVIFIY